MSQLEDISIRFQVYLEGLKTGESSDFNRVLPILEQILREELATGEVAELSRTQLERLVRRVRDANIEEIYGYVEEYVEHLKDLAVYAYEFEAGAIMSSTTAKALEELIEPEDAWRYVIQRPLSATGELLESWIDKLTSNQVNAIDNLLRRAHSEGWANSQILQVLRGTRANRYTDGLMNRLGSGNSTLIRTATQHVSSAIRMKFWEDNDDVVTGYRWVSTLDSKTSSMCRSLDGQIFEMGKGPLPPIHPNCRSVIVAVLSEEFDVFDRGATRSSANGAVPQSWRYYDWLKTQPKEFQDSVLGPVRGVLFRNGGMSSAEFARLQLSSTFDPLTIEEMRQLKPLAFNRAGI